MSNDIENRRRMSQAHDDIKKFDPYIASTRMSIEAWREAEGLESQEAFDEWLCRNVTDSVCPALCEECGDVEPDGHCQHGHPSVLIALGMI